MKKFLYKYFSLNDRKTTIKQEIIGGLLTFVAMCYIMPVNSSILTQMGMSQPGVFATTALVSFLVTMIMGLVAKYPIALSTGMGLNAYLTFSVSKGMGFTWQQTMILLTLSGIIFFVFSLTPVRKIILESIPKDIQFIISAAFGAFICFVGLKDSGIIISDSSTFVKLGSFSNPGVVIALVFSLLCFGLMMFKNKIVSNLAIPISILGAAIVGCIISSILIGEGKDISAYNLPIVPWSESASGSFGLSGVEDVVLFGAFSKDGYHTFGEDLLKVITTSESYLAMFSLCFVNLFNTTATFLAVGHNAGMMDDNGKVVNYRKSVLPDSVGALVCGPFGTSTVMPFVESNVGMECGAKSGLAACVSGLLFLLSAFIYPVFSIFTAGCVTAPALLAIGGLIFVNNLKQVDLKNIIVGFTAFITIILAILTYSISDAIGIGLMFFVVMMLISGKAKEVNKTIYIIVCFFVLSFILDALI